MEDSQNLSKNQCIFVKINVFLYTTLDPMEIEKKSLSPFNDKKYITREGDNFLSYSYGHYKIEEKN